MTNIDIKLPEALQQQLSMPLCTDLSLPKPTLPEIRLPTGGSIKGIADLTKGIPSDCSLNFSLALQLAPIMASIECLVKVLGLIKPLIDVVKGLTSDPPLLLTALPEFITAAGKLTDCFKVPTPFAMIPFIIDTLKLLIAMLRCVVQQLHSIVELLNGLEISIATATQAGNTDLLATLNCAKGNAQSALDGTMQGIEPIKVILELAGSFFDIVGVPAIKIPALAPAQDLSVLQDTLNTLQGVLDTMQAAVDMLS